VAERDDLEAARIVLQRLASRQKDSATDTLLFGKLCQEPCPRGLLLLPTLLLLLLGMPFLVSSGALLARSRRRTARASPQRRGRHRRRRRGAAGAGGGEARSPHISPYLPPISLQAQAEANAVSELLLRLGRFARLAGSALEQATRDMGRYGEMRGRSRRVCARAGDTGFQTQPWPLSSPRPLPPAPSPHPWPLARRATLRLALLTIEVEQVALRRKLAERASSTAKRLADVPTQREGGVRPGCGRRLFTPPAVNRCPPRRGARPRTRSETGLARRHGG